MAEVKKETGFYHQMVLGDLAVSKEYQASEHQLQHAGRRSTISFEQPQQETRKKEKTIAQEVVRVAQSFPLAVATGFAAVGVMAVFTLLSYIQLTALSADVVTLRSELSVLETQNIALTTSYEQMFDLATVKEVAVANGMTSPSPSQIYYIDLSGGDNATVYEAPKKVSPIQRVGSLAGDQVGTLVEYFR